MNPNQDLTLASLLKTEASLSTPSIFRDGPDQPQELLLRSDIPSQLDPTADGRSGPLDSILTPTVTADTMSTYFFRLADLSRSPGFIDSLPLAAVLNASMEEQIFQDENRERATLLWNAALLYKFRARDPANPSWGDRLSQNEGWRRIRDMAGALRNESLSVGPPPQTWDEALPSFRTHISDAEKDECLHLLIEIAKFMPQPGKARKAINQCIYHRIVKSLTQTPRETDPLDYLITSADLQRVLKRLEKDDPQRTHRPLAEIELAAIGAVEDPFGFLAASNGTTKSPLLVPSGTRPLDRQPTVVPRPVNSPPKRGSILMGDRNRAGINKSTSTTSTSCGMRTSRGSGSQVSDSVGSCSNLLGELMDISFTGLFQERDTVENVEDHAIEDGPAQHSDEGSSNASDENEGDSDDHGSNYSDDQNGDRDHIQKGDSRPCIPCVYRRSKCDKKMPTCDSCESYYHPDRHFLCKYHGEYPVGRQSRMTMPEEYKYRGYGKGERRWIGGNAAAQAASREEGVSSTSSAACIRRRTRNSNGSDPSRGHTRGGPRNWKRYRTVEVNRLREIVMLRLEEELGEVPVFHKKHLNLYFRADVTLRYYGYSTIAPREFLERFKDALHRCPTYLFPLIPWMIKDGIISFVRKGKTREVPEFSWNKYYRLAATGKDGWEDRLPMNVAVMQDQNSKRQRPVGAMSNPVDEQCRFRLRLGSEDLEADRPIRRTKSCRGSLVVKMKIPSQKRAATTPTMPPPDAPARDATPQEQTRRRRSEPLYTSLVTDTDSSRSPCQPSDVETTQHPVASHPPGPSLDHTKEMDPEDSAEQDKFRQSPPQVIDLIMEVDQEQTPALGRAGRETNAQKCLGTPRSSRTKVATTQRATPEAAALLVAHAEPLSASTAASDRVVVKENQSSISLSAIEPLLPTPLATPTQRAPTLSEILTEHSPDVGPLVPESAEPIAKSETTAKPTVIVENLESDGRAHVEQVKSTMLSRIGALEAGLGNTSNELLKNILRKRIDGLRVQCKPVQDLADAYRDALGIPDIDPDDIRIIRQELDKRWNVLEKELKVPINETSN